MLFYYKNEASIELFRENAIEAIFNVDENLTNSQLDILTAAYALNGTFLGMFSVSNGLLQLFPQVFNALF